MIEKTINFFWDTTSISWMRYMTLYSFRKLNPDWRIVLSICNSSNIKHKTWEDVPTQDFHNYTGDDYFYKLEELNVEIVEWKFEEIVNKNFADVIGPSHMSNFFKWHLLSEKNEFYSDMDILFLKPIEEYYKNVKDFDTIICYNGDYFSIGFLGSSGSNNFFNSVFENAKVSCTPESYQSAGVDNIYNLFEKLENPDKNIVLSNFWILLEKHFPENNKFNNPMSLFYPWTCSKLAQIFKECNTIPPDCLGIHWYAGGIISQEFNNKLTHENFKDYKNTFTYYVNQVVQG